MAPTTPGLLRVAAFCSALLLSATLAEPFLLEDLFYGPQPVDGNAPPLDPAAVDDNGLTPPPVYVRLYPIFFIFKSLSCWI